MRLKECGGAEQGVHQYLTTMCDKRHARLIAGERPGIKGNSTGSDEATEAVPLGIEQDLNSVGTSRNIERKHRNAGVWLVGLLSRLELRGVGRANRIKFLENDARRRVRDLHFEGLASELEGRIGTIDGDRSVGVHTPGNGGLNVSDLVLEQDLASAVNEPDAPLDVPSKAVSPSKRQIRANAHTLRMQC
jgi:hypothetical protein